MAKTERDSRNSSQKLQATVSHLESVLNSTEIKLKTTEGNLTDKLVKLLI